MVDLSGIKILRCLDCGKCTAVCPVARYNSALSPRRLVRRDSIGVNAHSGGDGVGAGVGGGIAGGTAGGTGNGNSDGIWSCLTCMYCDERCPQNVTISRLIPRVRELVRSAGGKPEQTRCSAMESVMVLQSQSELPQNRLEWLPEDVRTDPQSKTMLWVGCTPYFDTFFAENGVDTTAAVIAAIRILNALDIEPQIRADERCCGHDALWSGDDATFDRLAALNVEMFAEAQPERIITVCPECSLTLDREYRERFGVPAAEVMHISEFIAAHAAELPLAAMPQTVTFEDPCRLGRHQGKYDAPRSALATVPELELREMAHSRHRATCCAGSWLSCNQATKRIQTDLLREAAATGSELLVTACPKCQIHLKCAQAGDDAEVPDIEIRDLASVVAAALTVTTSAEEKG